ncbi:MAG TPA: GNAT family N-acetyltransferase [Noviherbaspirillum sp.]|uniref:GNAT family N-acetyltransferase n=1 Tax=Noviherbaspirillum sp. TaxID=1926288 RepID=UPI002D5721A6|nr:GNAT family N-acetyltransferase [Noviherbaspirillum sp.]HYD96561.1 GNAT family N-acetyltransferase [Noviherbaspirillum sp.]
MKQPKESALASSQDANLLLSASDSRNRKGISMKDSQSWQATIQASISIRPLEEKDLQAADHIMRLAFGTFIGLPNPADFLGDANYVHSRWHANPGNAFAAEVDGKLVGSNFATNWGSVGFFGPLTTHPDIWDCKVGSRLIEPVIARFDEWNITHAGLFTFPNSAKHHGLYQKFGFWPQFLTMVMAKRVELESTDLRWTTFSEIAEDKRDEVLQAFRDLTDEIYAGLDVRSEVLAGARANLGETVLLFDDTGLAAVAVCHFGPGTEAGSGTCYIKFGIARPGPMVEQHFGNLLEACEAMASQKGLVRLAAGVNTARHEAYRQMLTRGFRAQIQGVVMQRNNQTGYNRSGVYVIDDWR